MASVNTHPINQLEATTGEQDGKITTLQTDLTNLTFATTGDGDQSHKNLIQDLRDDVDEKEPISGADAIRGDVSALKDARTDHDGRITTNASDIATNLSTLNKHELDIADRVKLSVFNPVASHVEDISGEVDAIKTTITTLATKTALSAAEHDISGNKKRLDEHDIQIGTINDTNGQQNGRLTNLETDKATIVALNAAQSSLEGKIADEAAARVALADGAVKTNTDNIAADKILIQTNTQNHSGLVNTVATLTQTVADNKSAQDSRSDGIEEDVANNRTEIEDLAGYVNTIDHLTSAQKTALMEVFQNTSKNWFSASLATNIDITKDINNEIPLANIVSGAHEAYSYDVTNKCFEVQRSGYYKVAADITSVYTGD